jgi:tRNA-splicing endonuclease subunit Sen15
MIHVKYTLLSAVITRYPHTASAIFQTYNDLLFGGLSTSDQSGPVNIWHCTAQQWSELEIVDLPRCGRCGFRGSRPENVSFSQKKDMADEFMIDGAVHF